MEIAFAYFEEVARLGSIRQAAERLHVSASSISRQIAKLERAFGATLIERYPRGVKLTPAGEVVVRFVQGRTRELHRLQASIDALKNLQKGHVSIFTVEGTIGWLLPQALAEFSQAYPGVTYEVHVAGTDGVMEAVAEDRCDIGISFHPSPRRDVEPVASIIQPLLAVMSPSHRLAPCSSLSLTELADEPLALPNATFGIRHLVNHAIKVAQLDVNIRLETNSIDMIRQFALHEMGVTFLPAFSCERELALQELVALPLTDPGLERASLQICKHAEIELTAAAAMLVEAILATFKRTESVAVRATPRADLSAF